MDKHTILKNALKHLHSLLKTKGEIWIGQTRFSNYKVIILDDDLSIDLSGYFYGIDCFGYWEGIYYHEEKDLFFYVGLTEIENPSQQFLAFPIIDNLSNLLTPRLKDLIKEASFRKRRICVKYEEEHNFLELPG